MKTTSRPAQKSRQSSKGRSQAASAARKAVVKRTRPLHKRILLHPFTIMILLCVGVFVVGSTFRSFAASYDLTATVPAPIPASPAVIQQPVAGTHVSTKPLDVTGSCTPQSYVKLYRNSAFSGVGACSSNLRFSVQTDLSAGPNVLNVRIFNFTNQEGPSSLPITVYYAQPEPPATPPVSLQVADLEINAYQRGAVREVSVSPTVSGLAPPFSDVTVTFHSIVSTCKTKADARGVWVCTLSSQLVLGLHEVEVTAVTPDGRTLVFPSFKIQVKDTQLTVKQSKPAIALDSEYQYQAKKVGELFEWKVGIAGGTAPYSISVDWGDGTKDDLRHPNQSPLALSHAYESPKDYAILVTVTDANGQTTLVQWVAIVKDSLAYAAYVSTHKGGFASVLDTVKQWLWIVWPVYIAVVLMVFSFWLGEQEGTRRMLFRRQVPAPVRASSNKGKSRSV